MPKGEREAAKTHCPAGHEYSEANTRVYRRQRHCRTCDKATQDARGARQKAERRAGGREVIPTGERTRCPRGHAYDPTNTRVWRGSRFCRACSREKAFEKLGDKPRYQLLQSAKARAAKNGLPITITINDISIPDRCPALGIPLVRSAGRLRDASPSLDRIIPALGYVPGNVAVISYRANRIKSNATLDELARVHNWLKGALVSAIPSS